MHGEMNKGRIRMNTVYLDNDLHFDLFTCIFDCCSCRQDGMDMIVSMSSTILGFPLPRDINSASANKA